MASYSSAFHAQYIKLSPRYQTIRDCINDDVVSGDISTCLDQMPRQQYLIRTPGMADETYAALKQLGRFMNVTGSTLEMMMGAAWRIPPTIELPDSVDYLNTNADGEGNSLQDLLKDDVADTMSMGRFGVLVEPPEQLLDDNGLPRDKTKRDINDGRGQVYIKPYTPESIVDWGVSVVDGVKKLSLVKLREEVNVRDPDTYQTECETRYRFLILTEEGYEQRVYGDAEGTELIGEPVPIKDYSGKQLDHIAFYFSGSRNNDSTADNPPFYKIADRNIGHYNSDADWRLNNKLYATGTLFITGDNQDLGKAAITVGGGNGTYLGQTGSAQLLQVQAGGPLTEALKSDLDDMIQMGAKLSNPTVQRTAEEARISAGQDTALLGDVINNCQSMMREAVNEAIWMMTGVEDNEFTLDLNNQFFTEALTAQDRAQYMAEYMQSVIPFSTLFNAYKKAGIIPHDTTEEDFRAEIETGGTGLNFAEPVAEVANAERATELSGDAASNLPE
jgi:hypothetical protein